MRFVIPDDFPVVYQGNPELARLEALGEVVVYSTRAASPEELIERLQAAQVAINVRAYSIFDERLYQALPDLQMVSILGTGTDNFDLAAAERHGVVVTNTPGANAVSVAEMTIGLMIAVARQISLADSKLRRGEWYHGSSVELRGKTLGLLGLGAIGGEVARMAAGLGLRVIGWSLTHDPERGRALGVELVEKDDLIRQADVLSLHLRASPLSAGIIGQRELEMMKPTAFLINTARAALVDQDALLAALREHRIAGAGLDVFWKEPLPGDSPFLELDNVVLTPHGGTVTREANMRLTRAPIDNILAYLEGRPQHVVNPGALSHARQAVRAAIQRKGPAADV